MIVQFDDFEIDARALEIRRRGVRVAVPPQAVRALLVLVDHAGELVTREMLYDALWPEPDIDVDRALNTLIRQVRIALDDRAANPRYIRTYPRRGYRFLAEVRTESAGTVGESNASRAGVSAGGRPLYGRRLALAAAIVMLVAGAIAFTRLHSADPVTAGASSRLAAEAGVLPATLRDTYLEGRYLLTQPLPERRAEAVSRFSTVVAAQPSFAHGHAYLADALFWAGRPKDSRAAAERALALDPALPHAQFIYGTLVHVQDWDWALAERALREAVHEAPDVPVYHHGYAFLLATAGRHAEAIRELEHARSLDPASALVNADLGLIYLYAGRYAEAAHACGRALALEPGAIYAEDCAFEAHARGGDLAAALAYAARIVKRKGGNTAHVLEAQNARDAILGFRAWRANRVDADLTKGVISAFGAALLLAGAERTEAALDALDRAVRERSIGVVTLTVDPRFGALRKERRFMALAERMISHGAAPLGS